MHATIKALCGFWDLNSGSHACWASAIPVESFAQPQGMQYMCFSSNTSNGVAKFDSFPPKEGHGEPGSANREWMVFVFGKLHSVITHL